jgi:hypothetical protein
MSQILEVNRSRTYPSSNSLPTVDLISSTVPILTTNLDSFLLSTRVVMPSDAWIILLSSYLMGTISLEDSFNISDFLSKLFDILIALEPKLLLN